MPQSAELTAFYRAYAKWLDDGAPEDKPFARCFGLCSNTFRYSNEVGHRIENEMRIQFKNADLPVNYPFNDSSRYYDEEAAFNQMHLNPNRIQWVREHC